VNAIRRGSTTVAALGLGVLALLAPVGASEAAEPKVSRQEALRRAGERADKIENRFIKTWAWYAISEETCATDPAKAAELSEKLESWTAKRDLLAVVMYAWGKTDPKAAGDWGVKFKERTPGNLETKNTALHYAVIGMVWKDPKLADELIWKHLQEEGWGGFPRTAPMRAARELARSDPAAALTMAEKIKDESHRTDALRGIAREWAKRDPQAALAAMSARKEQELKKDLPRDIAEGWACKDPKAAAEYAKAIPDQNRLTKVMALCYAARELAKTNPQAAAELCRVLAPLNVGKWHEQMPRVEIVVAEVGQAFGKADPQAAAKWAASLPGAEGGCRAGAHDGVAAGWAAKDSKAALEFYQTKAQGENSAGNRGTGAAYPALARELAKTDVQAALALVEHAKSLVLKSNIVYEAAVELARRDPKAASAVVDKWAGVIDYYTYRTGAASIVAGAWAKKDAQAAAAWAEKLDLATDRLSALRAVAAAWVKTAPASADSWAQGLKDHREAAYALVGLAQGLR
jgi:hypothetical protein